MSSYATVADVQARVPYRTIGASTQPSTSQVQAWLDEAEAVLNGALKASELPAPYTDADAKKILGMAVADYAEGRLRLAYASAGGAEENQDGQKRVDAFRAAVESIVDEPSRWGAMLGGGTAPASARRIRGHVLDNQDGKTIAAGDFAPTFTRGEQF